MIFRAGCNLGMEYDFMTGGSGITSTGAISTGDGVGVAAGSSAGVGFSFLQDRPIVIKVKKRTIKVVSYNYFVMSCSVVY